MRIFITSEHPDDPIQVGSQILNRGPISILYEVIESPIDGMETLEIPNDTFQGDHLLRMRLEAATQQLAEDRIHVLHLSNEPVLILGHPTYVGATTPMNNHAGLSVNGKQIKQG